MLIVVLKLVGLACLLLPMIGAAWTLWRKCWPKAPASECLLAAAISTPVALLLEITLLGLFPFGRPLRFLIVAQVLLSAGGAWVLWRQRSVFHLALRQAAQGLLDGWRNASWLQRGMLALGLLVHLTAIAYGAWDVPHAWDELSYHLPQALQPYQDGRLGQVQGNLIWADSYPRGVTLLYYWTLQLAHTDAGFHPVNGTFGLVFILAVYVAAMRLGLGRGWAWLAAGIVPTSPIFWYLATIGYIDLSVGAVLAVVLTLSVPERDGGWGWGSCLNMLTAATLVLWMKFPPFAIVAAVLGIRGLLVTARWLAALIRSERPRPRPGPLAYAGAAAACLVFAGVPYLHTWMSYGSPVYPLRLRAGPIVLIDGPMDTSRFQSMNTLPLPQRYSAYWCGWYDELSTNSPGSFGPVFIVFMAGSALACLLAQFGSPQTGWLMMALCFWLIVPLPEYHMPRYGLYILLPGALCAVRLGSELTSTGLRRGWAAGILLLSVMNLHVIWVHTAPGVRWYQSMGLPLLTEQRNRVVFERVLEDYPFAPAPATRQALYQHLRQGETLVSAVGGFNGLFYDGQYSYRVEHRPARPWPYGFAASQHPEYGIAEAPAWLAGLLRDGIAAAMVYTDSAEERVLRAPGSGYQCVYEQIAKDKIQGIRIYRRQGS